ncbi:MAG TPA: cellulase family glycosylhydrolase [Myxococcota bacterium]|nr:cellulase family glycosylhydrolase [Myxococcota bacterium]HRY93035.1 cellulase family glycosylhydrolase [Myxococcota bacterium]
MKRPGLPVLAALLLATLWQGCLDGDAPPLQPLPLTRLTTDRTYLRDGYGRYVTFHGVNLSGSTKIPAQIDAGGVPTYVGKPFPLDDADRQFALLRELGFDSVRLLIIWEGLEPGGRGLYDRAYLAYLRSVVEKAGEHGLHVLLDMHQDMFSRHLMVKYNHSPSYGTPGSIENTLLALVPDEETGQYNDTVQGDGAPRWAVQACLQEKVMDSPRWGTPRILSGLNDVELRNIWELYKRLTGQADGGPDDPYPEWVVYFLLGLPGPFPVNETTDVLPFTHWGTAHALSLDVARCYGCLLAGNVLYPGLMVGEEHIQDYLQRAYAEAWAEVAKEVGHLPNVIGYDLMNEPSGNFLVLTAVAALLRSGLPDSAQQALIDLLGAESGQQLYQALVALKLLPPDTTPETLRAWGLEGLDVLAALGLNTGFAEAHLRPFYERVSAAILAVDPDAIIWIESSLSAENFLGGGPGGGLGGQWEQPMTAPAGVRQLVFAPHWYPDIYPFLGFNQPPREFGAEEVRHRSYDESLLGAQALAQYSLGNVPVVFGEFGTYFNLNGIEASRESGYLVSAHILDNYYEAFERLGLGHMQWCYSPENDHELGDRWNHEDFSVVGPPPNLLPRGQAAWARPHARFLAGKPHASRFWSPLHYFDPDKGEVNRVGEFEVRYGSRETWAPTEIVVPPLAYPDGFYVWVSDGVCHFDAAAGVLYHLPARDEPGAEHWVRLLPPLPGNENLGWQYFIRGARVVTR